MGHVTQVVNSKVFNFVLTLHLMLRKSQNFEWKVLYFRSHQPKPHRGGKRPPPPPVDFLNQGFFVFLEVGEPGASCNRGNI